MPDNPLPMRPLDHLVTLRTEKAAGRKDDSRPYVGLEHMDTGAPDLVGSSHASASISTNSVFEVGDVLFGKLRPNLRKSVLAPFPGYCSTDILVLRPIGDTNASFAAKIFQSELVLRRAVATAIGTKMPRTSWSALRKLEVFCPTSSEQRHIAAVLDTASEAIRKTEQVVAKLGQLHDGMLHDLLTRGIDENGQLRDPERHPDQFRDSRFGPIPKDWSIHDVGELLASVIDFRGRTPLKLGMSWDGGDIPALSAKNVRMGHIDLAQETYYGSKSLYSRWMTHGDPRRGDVLLTTEAPVGNVAQVPDERRYILSQRVVLLKFDPSWATNDFMAAQMRHWRFQQNLIRWSTGTTATGIQMAKMVRIPVVRSPLPEQEAIFRQVTTVEKRLSDEIALLEKLKKLKTGLSDDLLTARVRVFMSDDKAAA